MPPKKAQRTKGNVKPSSSSQAAQLLAASGQAPTGFIGFSTQPAFVPASEVLEESDSNLDADFRLTLRKLSKKDTTTKIKALQEFVSLCQSKQVDCVTAVLPFWPRIYNKVAIDVDHKVRELSQKALSALASRVCKAIAPHLKNIMGYWMVSMCDTYPTVASAANSAFVATFPGNKQGEAIRFCVAEIMECLSANILKHSAQTLSDPLTTSLEDMEAKYLRTVSASLQAVRKLMMALPVDSVSTHIGPQLSTLLSSPAFWKHANHEDNKLKGSVLSVLSSMCQLVPDISEKFLNKISPLVFSRLDSTDPNLVSYAWEAVLSLTNSHQECWEHVNWQKAVWPKLKRTLETGCGGQAAIISPCFLPLLSKIPADKLNISTFFECFRNGFCQDIVLNSQSDMSSLVKSFFECAQYVVKCRTESGESSAKVRHLVLDQVVVVVEASLCHTRPTLSRTDMYSLLCPFLTAVNSCDPEIEESFWSELSSFVRMHLASLYLREESNSQESSPVSSRANGIRFLPGAFMSSRLPSLLHGIVYRESLSGPKRERVKFGHSDGTSSSAKNLSGKQKHPLSSGSERFINDILVVTFTLSFLPGEQRGQFFHSFREAASIHIPASASQRLNSGLMDKVTRETIQSLSVDRLVISTDEEVLSTINGLMTKLNLGEESETGEYLHLLCSNVVRLLLSDKEVGTVFASEDVVLVFFSFLSYVNETVGADVLLAVLDNLTSPVITCQFIEQLLKNSQLLPACIKVLKGSALGKKIESFALTELEKGLGQEGEGQLQGAVWSMLTSVISSVDDSQHQLFSNSCLDAVMSLCKTTLKKLKNPEVAQSTDTISSVVSLVTALFEKHKLTITPQLGDMVLDLLGVILNPQVTDEDTQELLRSVLCDGVKLVLNERAHEEGMGLVNGLCTAVTQWAQLEMHSMQSLSQLSEVVKLLLACVAGEDDQDTEDGDSLKQKDEDQSEKDLALASETCDKLLILDAAVMMGNKEIQDHLYIKGNLSTLPVLSGVTPSDVKTQSPQNFALLTLYNLRVLTAWKQLNSLSESEEAISECTWSNSSLKALTQICENFIFIETTAALQKNSEWNSAEIMNKVKSDLVLCLKSVSNDQLGVLLDTALESERPSDTLLLGLNTTLKWLLASQEEMTNRRRQALKDARLRLQTQFLSNCLPESESSSEVKTMLSEMPPTAHVLCDSFTLALALINSQENVQLLQLSDCLTGFLTFASENHLLTDETKLSLFQQLYNTVQQLKEKDIHLLSSSDSYGVTVENIHYNRCVADALKLLMVACNEPYWEFCLLALVEWILFLSDQSLSQSSAPETKALMASVCTLAKEVASTFASAPLLSPPVDGEEVPVNTRAVTDKAKTEWEEFFSEGLYSPLLPMFVQQASDQTTVHDPHWSCVLTPLSAAVSFCPSAQVLSHQLPAKLTVTDTSALPDNLKTLLNHLCPLLVARNRSVQVAAYTVLAKVIPEIPKYETVTETDSQEEEEEVRSPPEALVHIVECGSQFLDSLMIAQVDEHIEMDTETEEHTQALGYLLTWSLLLQLFKVSPNQLRAKYAQYFKNQDSVHRFLDHLFRLIPLSPTASMLDFPQSLDAAAEGNQEELPQLSLMMYRQCLETLPALVRLWWADQNRKSSNFVDKFTSQYLSTGLIYQQIAASQSTENDMEGITIRARPAAREVCATYAMAEVTVNMTITLPENFPLGKMDVVCDKRVGVSQAQWDRWLLQLNIFLQHQNGSIVEGLRLWKGNIDKKFEGIDDCMICFSVIHGTTFQLPRLTCKTCRKKFHSACLYKWFNTSQKSSCPMCRNLF